MTFTNIFQVSLSCPFSHFLFPNIYAGMTTENKKEKGKRREKEIKKKEHMNEKGIQNGSGERESVSAWRQVKWEEGKENCYIR